MFNSTDPYNYGQNSIEYNPNGDSYNGMTGSMSNGSVMNAGVQGGVSSSSNNPFESFLTHAMALSNYVNGNQNSGQQLNNVGGAPLNPSLWQNNQAPVIGSGPAPLNPSLWPTTPSRPGVNGSIGQPPSTSEPQLNTGPAPLNPSLWPTTPSRPGVSGSINPTMTMPGDNKASFAGPNGSFNTLGYYQQWLPSMTQDQLNQYWTEGQQGQSQGMNISDWYGQRFNTDGSPKAGYGPNGSTPSSSNPGNMAGQYEPNQGVQAGQWNGPTFVQGYGWTQTPEEYQSAQNQVAQANASASAQSNPATPAAQTPAPAPGTPQAGSVQDMIHKMLAPLYQQQQGDLTRQLNANAAVTGDINSGGYTGSGPSSLSRQLSDLMAQQGSQESGYLQQANEDALQRALQLQLGQLSLQGTKYSADQGLQGARAAASATGNAAQIAANASMHNADQNYNLGLGNLDVSRENNLLNFMANMYGMTPQMLSALLASSPESLLSGQTVPTGNIIVKP